jgi:hypothetical protein
VTGGGRPGTIRLAVSPQEIRYADDEGTDTRRGPTLTAEDRDQLVDDLLSLGEAVGRDAADLAEAAGGTPEFAAAGSGRSRSMTWSPPARPGHVVTVELLPVAAATWRTHSTIISAIRTELGTDFLAEFRGPWTGSPPFRRVAPAGRRLPACRLRTYPYGVDLPG